MLLSVAGCSVQREKIIGKLAETASSSLSMILFAYQRSMKWTFFDSRQITITKFK